MELDAKIPEGPMDQKWTNYKNNVKLVSPANKRKLEIIVIGTGLAGASAAATLAELGYKVKSFCFQDIVKNVKISDRQMYYMHFKKCGSIA